MSRLNFWKRSASACAIAALTVPAAAAAISPSSIEKVSMKVSFEDLDIHSAAGARVLYARLQRASKSACGVRPPRELGSIVAHAQAMECYEKMLTKAVNKIDSMPLKAIHKS
jgi:UrcA family protein